MKKRVVNKQLDLKTFWEKIDQERNGEYSDEDAVKLAKKAFEHINK